METENKPQNDIKGMIKYDRSKPVLLVLGAIVIMAGIFCLGRMSGDGRQVKFGRNFNGSGGPMMERGEYGGGHMKSGNPGREGGISGQISAINGDSFTLKATDKDYTINIKDETSIIGSDGSISKKSDLKTNDKVVVSGPSNSNGEINATVIRINN